MEALKKLVQALQTDLAGVDVFSSSRRPVRGVSEYLLCKRETLKFKMYQESGRDMPHIHVDYGKLLHAASFSIDPPKRLAGELPGRYNKSVIAWIDKNSADLLKIWKVLQEGGDPRSTEVNLKGDA